MVSCLVALVNFIAQTDSSPVASQRAEVAPSSVSARFSYSIFSAVVKESIHRPLPPLLMNTSAPASQNTPPAATHLTVTNPGGAQIVIDGGYEVSKKGPTITAWLNGFGLPALGPGQDSSLTTAGERFNYSVRVYRLPGAPAEALECYVPINMKAYGTAQIVAQPPAIARASASFTVPQHYDWDGSQYVIASAETLEAEAFSAPVGAPSAKILYLGGQRDLVTLADNFLVDDTIHAQMTPQRGVVDFELRGTVHMYGEVAFILEDAYPQVEENVGGTISGYALVDPVLEIEPSWELADWFSIRVSSGVEQHFEVPEPSSGIILTSLIVSGLFGLRRRC